MVLTLKLPSRLYLTFDLAPICTRVCRQSGVDLEFNTWTQVTVTRTTGVVNIYFNNENVGQFGRGPTCTGTISTDNGGYEDHSCSIGHFRERHPPPHTHTHHTSHNTQHKAHRTQHNAHNLRHTHNTHTTHTQQTQRIQHTQHTQHTHHTHNTVHAFYGCFFGN